VKFVKGLLLIVIIASVAMTGLTLYKVIGVQRTIGQKQAALVGKVDRQNKSIVEISGAFKATEEMVGKTKGMLKDLKSLTSVVSDMNGLVSKANELQVTTNKYLADSNGRMGGLQGAAAAAQAPLEKVRALTTVTLGFINQTVSALSNMAGGLASTNAAAADMANMMEGKY